MAHVLILGMTESGKSTLAKSLCAEAKKRELGTLVLDPLADPDWCADYQTRNASEFLQVVKNSESCAVFIDESGESVGRYNDEMFWLATRGRHYGHICHFISQRGQQISKTVRDQCGRLYLFNCSLSDAKLLADEWNKEELRKAHTLAKGEFFIVQRFGEVKRAKLF